MAVYLLLLLAVCCYGMKFSSYHEDFISIPSTTAIKGIFAILILLSHAREYFSLGFGLPDRAFGFTMRYLGQLMVSPFFFYSGFGILESFRDKKGYVDGFLKKRVLKTWTHLILAVFLFLVLQTILGNHFEKADYLLCWIGWSSIGNSNWFIFVILVLYLISWCVLKLRERFCFSGVGIASGVTILSAAFWLVLFYSKSEDFWWYDTLMVFPAGMWFSIWKRRQNPGHSSLRYALIVFSVLLFACWRGFIGIDHLGICAILFVFALTASTTLVKTDNAILQWLGKHCFSIYMLQRLPMILLEKTQLVNYPFLFTGIVLAMVLILAYCFNLLTDRIDSRVFA